MWRSWPCPNIEPWEVAVKAKPYLTLALLLGVDGRGRGKTQRDQSDGENTSQNDCPMPT